MSWWWLLPTAFVSFWLGAGAHARGQARVNRLARDRWLLSLRAKAQTTCAYCGLAEGHTRRCSVTKFGVPPNSDVGPVKP
jgi:hypothetical protein